MEKIKKSPWATTLTTIIRSLRTVGESKKLVIPNLVRSSSSICLKIKIFFRFIIFNEGDTFTAFKYMIELLWIILNYFSEAKMLLVSEFNCFFLQKWNDNMKSYAN